MQAISTAAKQANATKQKAVKKRVGGKKNKKKKRKKREYDPSKFNSSTPKEDVLAHQAHMQLMKDTLPDDDPRKCAAMNDLASCYSLLDRHEEALRLGEESLAFHKRVLQKDDPKIGKCMLNLSGYFFDLEMYDEALRLGKQALSLLQRTLPENHLYTVHAMYRLAVTHTYLYRCEEALILFEKVLTLGYPEKIYDLKSRKWIKDIQLYLGSE